MEKGHYGEYSGNSRHSRVTSHDMAATKRDDEAHMEYLKEDIKYDNKHGHSDIDMTADEKHISKLAGDLKYDEKHHGAAQNHHGDIKQSPGILTQLTRRLKNDQTGGFAMARNLGTTMLALAPIPSIGKINAVKNIASAFGNTSRQYLRGKKAFSQTPKSKPVDFKGPNPANNIGAGGNSYPKTQFTSFANARISRTRAEREAGGY